jgi:hypothetical protein
MKTMNLGICSAVAAVAVAGSASAVVTPTVIDNFTTAGTLGAFGSNYAGLGTFSPGVSGGNYLGSRLFCNNSSGGTVNATFSGNGQFAGSLSAGTYDDTQLISQYRFTSNINMTQSATSTLYISGSGSASGAGYGIGVAFLTGATALGGWNERMWMQFNMDGTQSLGNFAFTLADLQASVADGNSDTGSFDFSAVNAMYIYQYAYGDYDSGVNNGSWNYTATSFSFVPAPGALALLGAAGMIGGTRRRR